jgi:tetratricopeptide (TPR) repeat protein
MRFIRGDSLKEAIEHFHADESLKNNPGQRSLALRKLLRRFTDVCNAIDYAHSRGVLHRDIKPGNVILGKFGETLMVDWGLAKASGQSDQGSGEGTFMPSSASGSAETLPGSVLGTPSYMSPEQAEGHLDHLGPRSDVYSLGATLYSLLTGSPPFEGNAFDVIRAVQRSEFRPPRLLDSAIDAALEAVCLKAMALKPEDRYSSSRVLAEDIERWMADEPVSAYREPAPARVGRWMRRHKTLVSGAAILLVTVLAAAGVGLVLLGGKNREIAQQRNAALTAANEAEAVNAFLTEDLLGQADPNRNARDKKVTVEELLHKAAEKIEGNAKLAGRPEVEATLRLTLGQVFFQLSDLAEAEKHLRRAVDLRRQSLGPDDPRTLDAQLALADFLGRFTGRYAEALPLALQTWQASARILGPEHNSTLESLDTYATALEHMGRGEEAISSYRQCLAARRRMLRPRDPATLTSANNLAFCLMRHGDYSEAMPLLRESLEGWRAGGHETDLAVSCANLVNCLYSVGELEEADRLVQESLERATTRLGAGNHPTNKLRWQQIRVWIDQGYVERAVALGREALALGRRSYPAGHPMIAATVMDLGRGLVLLKKFDEAEAALSESLPIFARTPQEPSPYYPAWAECWYGASLAGQRRYPDAEPHLLAAEKGLREARSTPPRHYRQALEQLAKLYDAWGKPDEAARWRTKLTPLGDSQGPAEGNAGNTSGSGR